MRSTFRPAWTRLPAVGALVVVASLRASAALAQTPAPTPTPTPIPGGENPSPASADDSRVRAEVERQMKLAEANRWTAGLNRNGGGAFLRSPDGKTYFRLYG